MQTISRVHDAVYQPASGQMERVFRSSSDPLFMGSDVARAGFTKELDAIRIKVQAKQVDAGEARPWSGPIPLAMAAGAPHVRCMRWRS